FARLRVHLTVSVLGVVESRPRGRRRNYAGGTSRDTRPRWRFRIGLDQRALFRGKELQQAARDGQTEFLPGADCLKALKVLFPFRIQRAQMEAFPLQRRDAAGGQDIYRAIQGHGARMKKIERPEVDGAASQIGTAGGLRNDGRRGGRKTVFGHWVCGIISLALARAGRQKHPTLFFGRGGRWRPTSPKSSFWMTKKTSG